jgi:hypothetical protein
MSALTTRIRSQCVEDGDCLLWQRRVSHQTGMPLMRLNGVDNVMVRRVRYTELNGEIPPGHVIAVTCGNKRCLAEGHLVAVTRGQARTIAAQYGAYQNPAKHRRALQTIRAKSHICETTVERIRIAESAKQAHQETGVSLPYCYAIRAGAARQPLVSPFAGLGSRA